MEHNIKFLGGEIFVKGKYDDEWNLLGRIKDVTVGMKPETHRLCKQVCKHLRMSYDIDHRAIEACHHPDNRPDGASWGECSPMACPMAKYIKYNETHSPPQNSK